MVSPIFMAAGDSVSKVINSVGNAVTSWATPILFLVGAILVIVAIIKIGKGLMSHGQGQVNWPMNIACLLIGALLIAASSGMFARLKQAGSTLNNDLNGILAGTAIVMEV